MKKRKLLSITFFSSVVVLCTYMINKLAFYHATIKDMLFSEEGNQYVWRFGKIFYTKEGQGPPLLLIHQLHQTSSGQEWRQMVQKLSKDHTVYVMDLLGCGRSEKPKMTYTNYLYVQLINDFIKDVIKEKTDVMTSGSSSSLAVMACHTEGDLFNRLMMINPDNMAYISKYPKGNHKALKYLIETPIIGTLIYNIRTSKYMIRKLFKNQYFSNIEKIDEKDIYSAYEAAHLGGASAKYMFSSIRSHYTNISISHAVKEMDHSLYIIGGADIKDIKATLAEYTNYNPSIEVSYIEDTKYLPQMEAPEKVLAICSIFLS